jgi:hypothetical protein
MGSIFSVGLDSEVCKEDALFMDQNDMQIATGTFTDGRL